MILIWTALVNKFQKILKSENASNSLNEVNAQCANDTRTWLQSLKLVAEVSVDCLISRKCNKKEIQIIKDNFYAIEREFLLFYIGKV